MIRLKQYLHLSLALGLMLSLVLPMTHGLGELAHAHHSDDDHCHINSHECSESELSDACHLSAYHGATNACDDHQHLTPQETECELCLWAELVRHDIALNEDDSQEPSDDKELDTIAWYQSATLQENRAQYLLRGPPSL